jgi:hypothetical protein
MGAQRENWESVIVQCRDEGEEPTVHVFVFHPDWAEPIEVITIRSDQSEGGKRLEIRVTQPSS